MATDSNNQKLGIDDLNVEDALELVRRKVDELRLQLVEAADRLVARARYERRECRKYLASQLDEEEVLNQRIGEEDLEDASEVDEEQKKSYSFYVLSTRVHKGQLELSWLHLKKQAGTSARYPVRVHPRKRIVHLNRILHDVQGLERELITNHEHQSRALREAWHASNQLQSCIELMDAQLALRRKLRARFTGKRRKLDSSDHEAGEV